MKMSSFVVFAFVAFTMSGLLLGEVSTNGITADNYISPVTGKPFPKDSKFTLEQMTARDERVLRKTGGILDIPSTGPRALFVDMREKPLLTVDEVARVYRLSSKLDANILKSVKGASAPLAKAQEIFKDKEPLFLVAIIENEATLPALSVFPEERIGLVNADKLKMKAEKDPSLPELRVAKEMWRAVGFIAGIGFSDMQNDMMQPFYTIEEIDNCKHAYIQPMNMTKMYKFMNRFDVKKPRRIAYRQAVIEGWALPPTNDYQKVVWQESKAWLETNKTNRATAPLRK